MHPNLLEQLMIFETAADLGGFSAAARQLNRTVSAVGYSIAQLEEQLDLQLFDRSGYRPELTPQGQALRRDTNIIMRKIQRFEARVNALKKQVTINTKIIISQLFPTKPLASALAEFAKSHPEIQITVQQLPDQIGLQKLQQGQADIVLGELHESYTMQGLDGRQIAASHIKLVVAPHHPLVKMNHEFPLSELDEHQQIILSPHPVDARSYEYDVHVTDIWAVNNVDLMKNLIAAGTGWGYMTEHTIADELANGDLVALDCPDIVDPPIVRYASAWRTSAPPSETLLGFIELVSKYCRPGL